MWNDPIWLLVIASTVIIVRFPSKAIAEVHAILRKRLSLAFLVQHAPVADYGFFMAW